MTTAIPTLIVDDEPAARRTLRTLLADCPFIRLEGEAASVGEAARLAEACAPQLVLLDITMPQRSGFELLPLLPSPFQVIVVTAFDDYAVRAFEFHAIDYLLKPIRRERLHLALQRARQRLSQPSAAIPDEAQKHPKDELILQADGEVRVVSAGNIAYVKAVGNYSQVNLTEGSRMLIRRSMEQWEELLGSNQFFRPHRSLIVNLRLMRGIRPINRDVAEVSIEGCRAPITVGRRASLLLRRVLGRKAIGQITVMEEAMPFGAL